MEPSLFLQRQPALCHLHVKHEILSFPPALKAEIVQHRCNRLLCKSSTVRLLDWFLGDRVCVDHLDQTLVTSHDPIEGSLHDLAEFSSDFASMDQRLGAKNLKRMQKKSKPPKPKTKTLKIDP
jgi:hypothetical protein